MQVITWKYVYYKAIYIHLIKFDTYHQIITMNGTAGPYPPPHNTFYTLLHTFYTLFNCDIMKTCMGLHFVVLG